MKHNQSKYWPQKCVRECLCAINAIKAKRVRECESYNVYKWLKWILSFGNFIRAIIIFDAFYSIDWYTSKTHAHTHTHKLCSSRSVSVIHFIHFVTSALFLYSHRNINSAIASQERIDKSWTMNRQQKPIHHWIFILLDLSSINHFTKSQAINFDRNMMEQFGEKKHPGTEQHPNTHNSQIFDRIPFEFLPGS